MRRFRMSTLMLVIVIAALGVAMVVQERRAARREAELRARLAEKDALVGWYRAYDSELKERLATSARRATEERRRRQSAVEAMGKKNQDRDEQ